MQRSLQAGQPILFYEESLMIKDTVNNVHVSAEQVLITPDDLAKELPVSDKALSAISESRKIISDIIHGRDHRLLVICGPCSIHDIDAAKDYALRLKELHESCKDTLFIVMRVYFEKPRTTTGWKGLINALIRSGQYRLCLVLPVFLEDHHRIILVKST